MNRKALRFFVSPLLIVAVLFLASSSLDLARADVVTVTATVEQTVTCSTNIGSTAFGVLSTAAVATAATNASTSLSCNTGLGCSLTVGDQGNGASPGLATSSPAYLIPSNTATLVAGTEGYGIQGTSTSAGSGSTLLIQPIYNVSSTLVGGLLVSSTPRTLASTTGQVAGRSVLVKHLAAISGTTQAAQYVDIITYSCTAN